MTEFPAFFNGDALRSPRTRSSVFSLEPRRNSSASLASNDDESNYYDHLNQDAGSAMANRMSVPTFPDYAINFCMDDARVKLRVQLWIGPAGPVVWRFSDVMAIFSANRRRGLSDLLAAIERDPLYNKGEIDSFWKAFWGVTCASDEKDAAEARRAYDNVLFRDNFSTKVHIRTGAVLTSVCRGLNYGVGGGSHGTRIFERALKYRELLRNIEKLSLGSHHATDGPNSEPRFETSVVQAYSSIAADALKCDLA